MPELPFPNLPHTLPTERYILRKQYVREEKPKQHRHCTHVDPHTRLLRLVARHALQRCSQRALCVVEIWSVLSASTHCEGVD